MFANPRSRFHQRLALRLLIAGAALYAVLAITPRLRSASTKPTFTQVNLVSDLPAQANRFDANLINPRGMALGTNSGIWIAANGSGTSTAYDGKGVALPSGSPQVITIPSPSPNGAATGTPSGVVTNDTDGFMISSNGVTGPATQLFATESGVIAGFSSNVDPSQAVIAVDNSAIGALYKGLAMGFDDRGPLLFATNFRAGTVDVFDSNFAPISNSTMFKDPTMPGGYAPFGIAAINSQIYVTYALQNAQSTDAVSGVGRGFIDVFDTTGRLQQRFVSQSVLNAPSGLAWSPIQGYGALGNALLVGNLGDGTINAFDFKTGTYLGPLMDSSGKTIQIPGLWTLQFGLGVANADSSNLFFTAGIQQGQHGLFGMLLINTNSLPPADSPSLTDTNLHVTTVISGLDQPTSMAFLGPGEFLILEKASGKVKRVLNGTVAGTVLDLNVNSASERGLLGIALAPDFGTSHAIYLYWTESLTPADTTALDQVPLLGNRLDRYIYDPNAHTLTFQSNLIHLRSFQADANQPMRANHDAGKIVFGMDGKIYFQIGDQGRRGQLQNLAAGPFGNGQADDQFGGPAPDDAHLTGSIFRLNPDGSTPTDNPFANVTADQIAQLEQNAGVSLTPDQIANVVANVHKVYSYGRRNGFGLVVDQATGFLWESENGDDAMDEINVITAGSNGGWIQLMGPSHRLSDFKSIESSFTPLQGNIPVAGNLPFSPIDPASFIPALQQVRWPPTLLANSPGGALNRLFVLPGSHYDDPEFSWKWAIAPAAIGFAGAGLGAQHNGKLWIGGSRTFLDGGYLIEIPLDNSRRHLALTGPLADGVDDNDFKFDEGESKPLIVGKNFGIVTDIQTGPDGNLYITSLSDGKVYMIH
jgi:uncharacterized protein (TIGR03118 family)